LPGIFRMFLSLRLTAGSAQIWHGLASYKGGAKQRSQNLFKIESLFTLRIRPLILD
jgi:hypothetical protein